MINDSVPVIRFSGYRAGAEAHRAVVEQMRAAAADTGFFELEDFGIPPGLIAEAFRLAGEFFALPDDSKRAILQDETWRGWEEPGRQALGDKEFKGGSGDRKESLRIWNDAADDADAGPGVAWSCLVGKPNKWPKDPPAFRTVFTEFWHACAELGDDVLACLEEALGESPQFLRRHHRCRNYAMRPLHYLPGVAPGDDWARTHVDWTDVTLLFQSDVGGLHVVRRGGNRTAIPPHPERIVVNIGSLLEARTHGRLVSTPHGVDPSVDATRDRLSIPFFMYPDLDSVLDLGQGPVAVGDFILSRFTGTRISSTA